MGPLGDRSPRRCPRAAIRTGATQVPSPSGRGLGLPTSPLPPGEGQGEGFQRPLSLRERVRVRGSAFLSPLGQPREARDQSAKPP